METKNIWPVLLNDKDRECLFLYMRNIKTGSLKMCTRNLYRETEMDSFKPIYKIRP